MAYEWDWTVLWRHREILAEGLFGTLGLTAATLACALPLGLLLACMRLFAGRAALVAVLAIEFLRTTPALVQLFWVFYALPMLLDIRLEPFTAAVLSLSLYTAAHLAEIFRGGIESIGRGQWDAARALGMRWHEQMARIVLPQMIRRILPPVANQAIDLTKTTALVATIAYADLLYNATVVASQTFRPLEIYTGVAVTYFLVLTAASFAVARLEARLARPFA